MHEHQNIIYNENSGCICFRFQHNFFLIFCYHFCKFREIRWKLFALKEEKLDIIVSNFFGRKCFNSLNVHRLLTNSVKVFKIKCIDLNEIFASVATFYDTRLFFTYIIYTGLLITLFIKYSLKKI